MINFQYSYSTAIGLFSTLVNLIILLSVNWFAKRIYQDRIVLERRNCCFNMRKDQVRILFDVFIYGLAICLILLIVYLCGFVIIALINPSDGNWYRFGLSRGMATRWLSTLDW